VVPLNGDAGAPAAPGNKARAEFHIPSLDGLRAVSFLIVFVSHAGLNLIPGGFGVTVFFFLSGYLITTLLRMEYSASQRVSLRDFYVRRALRILPPFYFVLALASLASLLGILEGTLEPKPMAALVLHYANYWEVWFGTDGQPPGTGVYWSLAVEEHFYLVFPFLFVVLQRTLPGRFVKQSLVLLALCAVVLAWRTVLVVVLKAPATRTFFATDTRVDSILFGCALAVGANPMLDAPRVSRGALLYGFLPLGIALLAIGFVVRGDVFRETLRYTLQGLGLAPVFVAAMREPGWAPFRWLNRPLPRRLGALSYSLYLVHQVVLIAFEQLKNLPALPRGVIALAISLALAELIQRTIEKPCARLRRKFAHATWMSQWTPPPKAEGGTPAAA
jgi:peptidoglycan/LPS O-acetylase OafA/YrhL